MTVTRLEVGFVKQAQADLALVTAHSSHTNRRQDISIYNAAPEASHVPVVILLHGVYGSHWVWQTLGKADQVYETLSAQGLSEFVLIMPSDGGIAEGSGYLPLTNGEDYEQWIVQDVVAAVQQVVTNVTDLSPLYLCGLSMGGYGAIRLGCKFAEQVAAISAHSAITRLSDLSYFTQVNWPLYPGRDSDEASILYWAKRHKYRLPPIRFDCGKEDILFSANETLSASLSAIGVMHIFDAFEGGHNWSYWQQHLSRSLCFFDRHFKELRYAQKPLS